MENNLFQRNNPKRQKLIKPLGESETLEKGITEFVDASSIKSIVKSARPELFQVGVKPKMLQTDVESYIQSLGQLQDCLRTAFQLELSTIPPYLCGLYTIKEGSNTEVSKLIRSIVVEEMLHMILVANILNAITDPKTLKKGEKLFNIKKIIPIYPTTLPGNIIPPMPTGTSPFKVHLRKFSREALAEFITIEKPSRPEAAMDFPKTFDSIGQFYQAIRYGLRHLNVSTPGGIFKGNPMRQVRPEHYYGSGGKIVKVECYEDAETAIEEIVGQGEGIDGTIATEQVMFGEEIEYAHYFKFQEISYGRMYSANDTNFQMPVKSVPTGLPFDVSWSAVYNMKANPKIKDYKNNPALLEKAIDFNRTYLTLLNNINDAVSGQPKLLIKATTLMYDLKYKAQELLNIPLGNGECAGPTFEYMEV